MTAAGPVAVTGARGRLGRALVARLRADDCEVAAWSRPDYDLDDPVAAGRVVERDRPGLVIHAAAWTDVDGCAREPDLAMRRNGQATAELARACAAVGAGLVLISTNEVFDGTRADGRGYAEDDPTAPPNPYGASKLAGERAAREAFAGAAPPLWVVRTAWLFGPPGNDFPAKILARADALGAGERLPVVSDEVGSPTYTADLAEAILELVDRAPAGTYHLVNTGQASRYEYAATVLALCGRSVELEPISRTQFERPSVPPALAVLDCSRAARFGVALRPWPEALADYLARAAPPP